MERNMQPTILLQVLKGLLYGYRDLDLRSLLETKKLGILSRYCTLEVPQSNSDRKVCMSRFARMDSAAQREDYREGVYLASFHTYLLTTCWDYIAPMNFSSLHFLIHYPYITPIK